MTPTAIASRCLPLIGVYSFDTSVNQNDASKRPVCDGDKTFIAGCITGAMGEMFEDGPASLSEDRYSSVLLGPTGITLNVTQYSTAITGVTAWNARMIGQTVRIQGDAQDNVFISQTTLLRPYMGVTAAGISATVFGDAIQLPQGTDSVLEPVEIPLISPLLCAKSAEEFRAWGVPYQTPGNRRPDSNYYLERNKPGGQPSIWFAEGRLTPTLTYLPIFLRVNPMPGQDYPITLRRKLEPPVLALADIGTPDTPSTFVLPVPWHESVLLPYVLQRFTAHEAFLNKDAKQEINRQYQAARVKLLSWTPSGSASFGQYPA